MAIASYKTQVIVANPCNDGNIKCYTKFVNNEEQTDKPATGNDTMSGGIEDVERLGDRMDHMRQIMIDHYSKMVWYEHKVCKHLLSVG